jgi:hypothetical protein
MCSYDVSILDISVVERRKFPSRRYVSFFVPEFCDVPKDCDLFNEVLERTRVHRERRISTGILHTSLFVLLKFRNPDTDNLFKPRTDEIAKGCILARSRLKDSIAKSFAQVRKFIRVSIGTQCSHRLLPVVQVSIINNVPQVFPNNRSQ